MNLIYIANVKLPTEKAQGVQIVEMCHAFSKRLKSLSLFVPKRRLSPHSDQHDFFSYYHISPTFNVTRLYSLDVYGTIIEKISPHIAYYLQLGSFIISTLFINVPPHSIIYTREKLIACLHGLCGRSIIYESHDHAGGSWLDTYVAHHCKRIICITRHIENSWLQLNAPVTYAPDGVGDIFFKDIPKEIARKKLRLDNRHPIILYAGNIYPWKGVDTLLAAALRCPHLFFYIVGGEKEKRYQDLKLRYNLPNIIFMGNRPYPEIPLWLKAADVLVLPSSAKFVKSRLDTSALKLFEYLASHRPIVASRIPSTTEVIDEKEAWFFTADDPIQLAQTLQSVIHSNPQSITDKCVAAFLKAQQYTWHKRAQLIIDAI